MAKKEIDEAIRQINADIKAVREAIAADDRHLAYVKAEDAQMHCFDLKDLFRDAAVVVR